MRIIFQHMTEDHNANNSRNNCAVQMFPSSSETAIVRLSVGVRMQFKRRFRNLSKFSRDSEI